MSASLPGPVDPAPGDADTDVIVDSDEQLHAVGNLIMWPDQQPTAAFCFSLFRPQELMRVSAEPKHGA